MDPWLAIIAQMMKSFQGNGGDNASVRNMIQDEIRRSQNVENSEMLRQILASLEHKHAAELQEATLEAEKHKLEAEFFKKQLEELSREKKSAEKTEKMKQLASHMAGLSLQKPYAPSQKYQKQNKHAAHSSNTTQSDYNGGTLPWLDPVKGNTQTFHHNGGGNRGRGYQHRNNTTPNQNFMQTSNFQQKLDFQHNPNFQHYPNFQQNPNVHQNPHFQQNPNVHQNPHFQQNPNVHQNPHFQPNPNVHQNPHFQHNPNAHQNPRFHQNQRFQNSQHDPNFQPNPKSQETFDTQHHPEYQEKHYSQQPRGQNSNRYRGRGQRGGGRGRSSSVGRDKVQSEVPVNTPPSSTFHIQVTKVGGQWVSTENISTLPNTSHRGTGNFRSRGRGRAKGDGHAYVQPGVSGGQQAMPKKNRKKNPQNEHGGEEKQLARNKQKNNEGDPEENCKVS